MLINGRPRGRTILLSMVDHTIAPSRTCLGRTLVNPVMVPCMGTLTDLPLLRPTEATPDRLADIIVIVRTGEGTRTVLPALLLTGTGPSPSLGMASATILSA